MPPKRRASGRKRRRSPDVSSPPRPTQAPRLDNEDRVVSPVPEAEEPQGGPAGAGEAECACVQDDCPHKLPNIPDEKLTERELRLQAISEDIASYYLALEEAREKLGSDSTVVKLLEKGKKEALTQLKRIDAEKTPDVEAPADEAPDNQREVQTLEQRQLALESSLFLLRGNVIPMIEDLERDAMALRDEIGGRQE